MRVNPLSGSADRAVDAAFRITSHVVKR